MIPRPLYTDKIMGFVDKPFIKILTGVRRCGKSTIMDMVAEELKKQGVPESNVVTIRLSQIEYDNITAKELYEQIKSKLSKTGRTYLFLDEIQEVEGWERMVNTFFEGRGYDVDIFITGSNSRMLSSEISTYLTGRYVSMTVFPLSFAEYLRFRSEFTDVKKPNEELEQYIRWGGFPAVHRYEMTIEEAYVAIEDIYNTTIYTDIVKRNEIRKVDLLERIVKFTFDNVGKTFSAKSISDYFKSEKRKVDIETIYSYLKKLESAFILHRCSRFDLQGKEILKLQEKFYLADSAFKYAVLGFKQTSVAPMLENIVYLELKRRGYEVYVGKYGELEIDFVAERRGDKIYIQVTKEMEKLSTEEREFENLLKIQDNYPKYVLSMSGFAHGNYKGVISMHIADFLLDTSI